MAEKSAKAAAWRPILVIFLLIACNGTAFQPTSVTARKSRGTHTWDATTSPAFRSAFLHDAGKKGALLQHANGNCDRDSRLLGRLSTKWSSFKQSCGQRLKRKNTQTQASLLRPKNSISSGSSTRQRILSVLGVMVATLVMRPVQVLAMGGGMGGPKGPVTPMSQ